VPAFTGLGAPYWDASARGALFGLTRETGAAEIVQATLEAVCYQTRDLIEAMIADGAARPASLRVDGGMTKNAGAMQLLADILGVPVERPVFTETTVAGAAALASLGAGLHESSDAFARSWRRDRLFEPRMSDDEREERYVGWRDAVRRTLTA
jgi:glycerol kinase